MLQRSLTAFKAISDDREPHTFHLLFRPDEVFPNDKAAFLVFDHHHHDQCICSSDFFSLTFVDGERFLKSIRKSTILRQTRAAGRTIKVSPERSCRWRRSFSKLT